jgi:hypothetical protein
MMPRQKAYPVLLDSDAKNDRKPVAIRRSLEAEASELRMEIFASFFTRPR